MDYMQEFIDLVDGPKLLVLMAMIFANLILGLAVAIKLNKFDLKQIAGFLTTRVLPFVLGYFSVGLVALVEPSFRTAVPVVWGLIIVTLVGAMIANLHEIGIEIPGWPKFLSPS